jgi:erythronate-4-phosphate dehydrogenase
MKTVLDQNIPAVQESFARHGTVVTADGRELDARLLSDADALVVRSVTPVGAELLAGTSVGFVGTATIGFDHLDTDYLDRAGIRWCSAPGCNADAAAQYSLAIMLLACRRLDRVLSECKVGIVGRGNVGGRLERMLNALRVTSRACDPPLADRGESGLCTMDDIRECDIISFHVPLTTHGPYPTRHMVDQAFLSQLPADTLLVNTARGEVAEGQALLSWLSAGSGHAALDVWPGEPEIDVELLRRVVVATPHVAGYSLDGKYRGTAMVYAQFRDWLGLEGVAEMHPGRRWQTLNHSAIHEAIGEACPVERDDRLIRALKGIRHGERAAAFDALRRDYPSRRDFVGWRIPDQARRSERQVLRALGFSPRLSGRSDS